ncbi:O-acetyl-ADP-ribose deacetylase macrod1 [Modicella reniformis]|uniref:O-acetyl-ADP-ribose deacetylase macrod1 n=1 Tax=Modicella reniformis TaxID=1440133 RepID=A0A9P6MJR6_9FUNG|nr:O-acetyl-ADP-ribose deacetylase macrod1 [Modicella reniformis]
MSHNKRHDVITLEEISTLQEKYNHYPNPKPGELEYSPNKNLGKLISLWQGDMTTLKIDAIVNAANSSLLGGGGIDGAIHRAAGKELLAECRTLNGCDTGNAKITLGYKLPSAHVIHTVGPMGEYPTPLKSCYKSVLEIVKEKKLESVAFCCISTGIYGYDNLKAAHVALKTIREWLDSNEDEIERHAAYHNPVEPSTLLCECECAV